LRGIAKALGANSHGNNSRCGPRRLKPRLEQLEGRLVPTAPNVVSILRQAPLEPITNASSVTYAVTFNEAVTGVNFQVVTDGNTQVASPVAVSNSGSAYTVAVNGIHDSGDLRVDPFRMAILGYPPM
jgi:hypothetical protein